MKRGTRYLALGALLALLASPLFAADKTPPITGTEVAEFRELDKAVVEFMQTIEATAAAVAVSKDGKLLHSRGFGHADQAKKKPTPPDTLFRIASVSKPITAAMVKAAIKDKKLDAEAKAFDLIGAKPSGKWKIVDDRVKDITVKHLLQHKGGWDSTGRAGDIMFKPAEIAAELKLTRPLKPGDVVTYMLCQPLQFEPGSKEVYSNFGYCLLGRVLETVHKTSFADCLQEQICKPLGVKDIKVGVAASKKRDPREVWYPVADDAFPLDVMDSHGGLIASAPAVCEFLGAYWVNGEPRPRDWVGGQGTFFGSLPGTTAMARQRPDGLNVVVLFNNRRNFTFRTDNDALKKAVDAAVEGVVKK